MPFLPPSSCAVYHPPPTSVIYPTRRVSTRGWKAVCAEERLQHKDASRIASSLGRYLVLPLEVSADTKRTDGHGASFKIWKYCDTIPAKTLHEQADTAKVSYVRLQDLVKCWGSLRKTTTEDTGDSHEFFDDSFAKNLEWSQTMIFSCKRDHFKWPSLYEETIKYKFWVLSVSFNR